MKIGDMADGLKGKLPIQLPPIKLPSGFGEWVDELKGKLNEWLDAYKAAMTTLEPLGLSMGNVTITMATLPEVHASMSGAIDKIRDEDLKRMMSEHPDDKLLGSMLKALIAAKQVWEHFEPRFTRLTVNVSLGINPKVTVKCE